jgi:6,7-dimethyl-8-ribityllumazine synthase
MRQHHQTRAGSNRPNLERHEVAVTEPAVLGEVRIAVLASSFNGAIVERLTDGALGALLAAGIPRDKITYAQVPGAWELPQLAEGLARAGWHHAIVALGCVIRGETSHYDVIVGESARGLMHVALAHAMPVANGVLTCENEEQALARSGGSEGNKGADAAQAALDLLAILRASPGAHA